MKPNEGILDLLNLGYCSKHIAQGESDQRPVLEIGNTNSRYRFSIGAKRFMNEWSKQGPAHHCAIGVGHLGNKIEKLAFIMNIPITVIC